MVGDQNTRGFIIANDITFDNDIVGGHHQNAGTRWNPGNR